MRFYSWEFFIQSAMVEIKPVVGEKIFEDRDI